ncbi:MAG: hypothetical protein JXR51_10315 [Bacteroidales bacterium]|nr:hypothetical protein [Bacteroidales bacterium]MBN2757559.1 hypothetical protein [Bacteroidales bacterium]
MIYFTKISALIFIICTLISCSNNNDVKKENNSESENIVSDNNYENSSENEKIYIIDKKSVIFFMPGKKEYERLYKEIGESYKYELDYLFNNFKNQQTYFSKELQKNNIYSTMRFETNFQIIKKDGSAKIIRINKEEQIMGEILFDGIKETRIEYGMYTNKELAEIIQDYFNLNNISYFNEADSSSLNNNQQIDNEEENDISD